MIRRYISIVIIALCVASAYADTHYMDMVSQADKACSGGNWEEAELSLLEAMQTEPDNPGNILLMSNLGMVRYHLGKDSLAVSTLTDAHRMAPSSVTILSNRASVLTALGYDQDAMMDYELIMDLDSTDIKARYHHGLLAMRCRKFAVARTDFEFLNRYYPDREETQIAMASFHCSLGEYAQALPYYNTILETRKEPEFYGARAYCNLMTDRLQEASDDIAEALALAPDDPELYLYRAALAKMRFRPEDAKADAMKALELGIEPARAAEFIK